MEGKEKNKSETKKVVKNKESKTIQKDKNVKTKNVLPQAETKEHNTKKKSNASIKETKENVFKGVGIGILVVLILGLAYWVSSSYGDGSGTFEFTYITVDEYLDYMKGSESKIIYVAKPECSFCQKETPIIKKLGKKYNLEINYLDTTNFTQLVDNKMEYTESGIKFMESADVYKEGWGTPNTIIVKDGKIIDGIYQYVPENELKTLFKNNGLI